MTKKKKTARLTRLQLQLIREWERARGSGISASSLAVPMVELRQRMFAAGLFAIVYELDS